MSGSNSQTKKDDWRYKVAFMLPGFQQVKDWGSNSPFPSIHEGDFLGGGCFPPMEGNPRRFKVLDVEHQPFDIDGEGRDYLVIQIEPVDFIDPI